jgi:hypothetical protein
MLLRANVYPELGKLEKEKKIKKKHMIGKRNKLNMYKMSCNCHSFEEKNYFCKDILVKTCCVLKYKLI